MAEQVISKIRIPVIIPDEPPEEFMKHWVSASKKAASRTAKGLRKAISNIDEYTQKIAQPAQNWMQKFIDPKFRSKKGLTLQSIIDRTHDHIETGYRKFKRKTRQAFKKDEGKPVKHFSELIDSKAYYACKRISQLVFPFKGFRNVIRGIGPFAARWLTGDKSVTTLLRKREKAEKGGPVMIIKEELHGKFKKEFINRITQSGAASVRAGFDSEIIQMENDRTNEMINQYIRDGILPFATGGASYVDFMVEEIPDATQPEGLRKNLCLNIQVSLFSNNRKL
jgi:hypothetical protein